MGYSDKRPSSDSECPSSSESETELEFSRASASKPDPGFSGGSESNLDLQPREPSQGWVFHSWGPQGPGEGSELYQGGSAVGTKSPMDSNVHEVIHFTCRFQPNHVSQEKALGTAAWIWVPKNVTVMVA